MQQDAMNVYHIQTVNDVIVKGLALNVILGISEVKV